MVFGLIVSLTGINLNLQLWCRLHLFSEEVVACSWVMDINWQSVSAIDIFLSAIRYLYALPSYRTANGYSAATPQPVQCLCDRPGFCLSGVEMWIHILGGSTQLAGCLVWRVATTGVCTLTWDPNYGGGFVFLSSFDCLRWDVRYGEDKKKDSQWIDWSRIRHLHLKAATCPGLSGLTFYKLFSYILY